MLIVPYFESSAIHHDGGIELLANPSGWSELVSRSTCEQRNHLLAPRASCRPSAEASAGRAGLLFKEPDAILGPPELLPPKVPLSLSSTSRTIRPSNRHPSPSCTLLAVARPSWLVPRVQAEDPSAVFADLFAMQPYPFHAGSCPAAAVKPVLSPS
jgi:hypothetical protein